MLHKNTAIAVVGAGPAGTATVGALLEKGYSNILWIDPYFLGGQFREYWGIPANTRSTHLSYFANFLQVFSNHSESADESVDVFQHYEPTETANLDELRLCLIRMTNIIRKYHSKQVSFMVDTLKQVVEKSDLLQLHLEKGSVQKVKKLFVCIGAKPKTMNVLPGVMRLNLYEVMSPFAIEKYDLTNEIVDVFGSRNSGLLVLKNLMAMRRPPKLVRHYLNKQLVYAEYIEDFIRHNFTGLKGAAKEFGQLYQKGQYKGRIITYQYDPNNIPSGATRVVEAVGFSSRKIDFTDVHGKKGYTLKSSQMHRQDGSIVQSIHFTGFVNPRIITDQEGETMPAVGVNVFLDHSLSIIKQWEHESKL